MSAGNAFFVYGLYDSGDWGACRYVGAASHLRRPLNHVRDARISSSQTHKPNWIRKVIREGRHVGWKIIVACEDWPHTLATERAVIQALRASGAPLINQTAGGLGGFIPASQTPEARAKRSAAQTGRKMRPESIKKSSDARRGQKRTSEAREKMAAAKRGKSGAPRTAEWLANQSAARIGKKYGPQSPELVERRVAKLRGRKRSPDVVAKIAAALRGRRRSPEVCANISAGMRRRTESVL